MNKPVIALSALSLLAACGGKEPLDSASPAVDDTGAGGADGYTLSGTVQDLQTGETDPEGLCVEVIDRRGRDGGGGGAGGARRLLRPGGHPGGGLDGYLLPGYGL
jgi:hypothetical protein